MPLSRGPDVDGGFQLEEEEELVEVGWGGV
jgi:hypothetical protein